MTYTNAILVVLALLSAYAQAIGNTIDPSTYANIEDAKTTHVDLDIEVDFDSQVFIGKVVHTMKTEVPNVKSIFFDAEGLTVSQAEFITVHGGCQIWQNVAYVVSRPNDNLGDAIEVMLPHDAPPGLEFRVRLTYVTNNKTTAISWLKPS